MENWNTLVAPVANLLHVGDDVALFIMIFVVISGLFSAFFAFKKISQTSETPKQKPTKTFSQDQFKNPDTVSQLEEPVPVLTSSVKEPEVDWLTRLKNGLSKSQNQLRRGLGDIFMSGEEKSSREKIYEGLFELLIQADVGVKTANLLLSHVKEKFPLDLDVNEQNLVNFLKIEILQLLNKNVTSPVSFSLSASSSQEPYVFMVVGVNGVGKTTTVGKLAHKYSSHGHKVVIGAGDTFRAAAIEQLAIWAERANAQLVTQKQSSDPAAVAFESVRLAKESQASICFVDTAGRLQNKNELMQELAKIKRVMGKEIPTAPHEVLLVLDATTGQNALQQAKIFSQYVDVTGIVLTKLDGTAKGGIALAIVSELNIPIRFIGVGESVEDLEVFSSEEYVNALLGEG